MVNTMILNKIKKEQIQARKNKENVKATLLTTLISEIEMIGKNAQRETSDSDAILCLNKFKKGAQETLKLVMGGAITYRERRAELENEINLYDSFLPKPLSEEELKQIILNMLASKLQMKDIMVKLKSDYAGQYDGKLASELIKKLIS